MAAASPDPRTRVAASLPACPSPRRRRHAPLRIVDTCRRRRRQEVSIPAWGQRALSHPEANNRPSQTVVELVAQGHVDTGRSRTVREQRLHREPTRRPTRIRSPREAPSEVCGLLSQASSWAREDARSPDIWSAVVKPFGGVEPVILRLRQRSARATFGADVLLDGSEQG